MLRISRTGARVGGEDRSTSPGARAKLERAKPQAAEPVQTSWVGSLNQALRRPQRNPLLLLGQRCLNPDLWTLNSNFRTPPHAPQVPQPPLLPRHRRVARARAARDAWERNGLGGSVADRVRPRLSDRPRRPQVCRAGALRAELRVEWSRWPRVQFESENVGRPMQGHTTRMWERITGRVRRAACRAARS